MWLGHTDSIELTFPPASFAGRRRAGTTPIF